MRVCVCVFVSVFVSARTITFDKMTFICHGGSSGSYLGHMVTYVGRGRRSKFKVTGGQVPFSGKSENAIGKSSSVSVAENQFLIGRCRQVTK